MNWKSSGFGYIMERTSSPLEVIKPIWMVNGGFMGVILDGVAIGVVYGACYRVRAVYGGDIGAIYGADIS